MSKAPAKILSAKIEDEGIIKSAIMLINFKRGVDMIILQVPLAFLAQLGWLGLAFLIGIFVILPITLYEYVSNEWYEYKLNNVEAMKLERDPKTGYKVFNLGKDRGLGSMPFDAAVKHEPFMISGGVYVLEKIYSPQVKETEDKSINVISFTIEEKKSYYASKCIDDIRKDKLRIDAYLNFLKNSYKTMEPCTTIRSCVFIDKNNSIDLTPLDSKIACNAPIKFDRLHPQCEINEGGVVSGDCKPVSYIFSRKRGQEYEQKSDLEAIQKTLNKEDDLVEKDLRYIKDSEIKNALRKYHFFNDQLFKGERYFSFSDDYSSGKSKIIARSSEGPLFSGVVNLIIFDERDRDLLIKLKAVSESDPSKELEVAYSYYKTHLGDIELKIESAALMEAGVILNELNPKGEWINLVAH